MPAAGVPIAAAHHRPTPRQRSKATQIVVVVLLAVVVLVLLVVFLLVLLNSGVDGDAVRQDAKAAGRLAGDYEVESPNLGRTTYMNIQQFLEPGRRQQSFCRRGRADRPGLQRLLHQEHVPSHVGQDLRRSC